MADYSVEIAALRQAVATGSRVVVYDNGRRVEFDTFESLLARIRYLESLQNPAGSANSRPSAGFATFSRGDR